MMGVTLERVVRAMQDAGPHNVIGNIAGNLPADAGETDGYLPIHSNAGYRR